MRLRVLFVSGTTGGGSGRSQRELAAGLTRLGHDVTFLVDDKNRAPATRYAYDKLSDASVRIADRPGGRAVALLRDSLGRRTVTRDLEGTAHRTTPVPQNALVSLVRETRPDVIVVNSVERWAWRRIHEVSRRAGIPTILYVREEDTLGHLASGATPTVLVANALSLAERMRSQGHRCAYVPSVIDTSVTRTESTRHTALVINPIPSKGADLVWQMARGLPEISFVAQESWPLAGAALAEVESKVAELPNVEFRRRRPPGPDLYGDARVLLVPYRMDSRPRVVLEAQANAIPVVTGDVPALVEATGPGGVSVPLESVSAWVDVLRNLWSDPEAYNQLAERAQAHSARAEADPTKITAAFEKLLVEASENHHG